MEYLNENKSELRKTYEKQAETSFFTTFTVSILPFLKFVGLNRNADVYKIAFPRQKGGSCDQLLYVRNMV